MGNPAEQNLDENDVRMVQRVLRDWRGSRSSVTKTQLRQAHKVDERYVRLIIAELRRRGELIIADPGGGYRYAHDAAEVEAFVASLKSRVVELRRVIEAMEDSAQKEWGSGWKATQLDMFR